jgi:uncharacterized protein (TIGR02147 family)
MNQTKPSIYEYNDFRKYLADYQKIMVRTDRSFSASNICRRLGMSKTRSYFADVLKGKLVRRMLFRICQLQNISIAGYSF